MLTLNRPEKRNALNNAVILALADALDGAAVDRSIRCVLLRGSDSFFSAGADIKEMHEQGFSAIDNPARRNAWDRIAHFPKPLVAAIEGIAYGGGHELALLADIVIAARNARFAQPEINIGILPGDGATQRIARIAGKPLTMLMVLTGEPIDAATAQQAGLVAELTEPGDAAARALEIARSIAAQEPQRRPPREGSRACRVGNHALRRAAGRARRHPPRLHVARPGGRHGSLLRASGRRAGRAERCRRSLHCGSA